jgi:hypothetical protein
MRQIELAEKKEEEEERDYWFNRLRPVTKPKQTRQEKWLSKEEGRSSGDSSGEEVSKVTPAMGEDNPGSSDGNPKLGNCSLESGSYHPESRNYNLGKENDRHKEDLVPMDVNMVFTIPAEFCATMEDVSELMLGVKHAVFEKSENPGVHMKPLFIRG